MSDIREDIMAKDNKIKQLRYENDRLFNDLSILKNASASAGVGVSV